MISGSLPTVAGLCGDHHVVLVDENVEDIDWDLLRACDIVGVTGMNVQRRRIREILLKTREMGLFTVGRRSLRFRPRRVFRRTVRRGIHW